MTVTAGRRLAIQSALSVNEMKARYRVTQDTPDLQTLQSQLAEGQAELTQAQASITQAGQTNNIPALVAAAKAIQDAEAKIKRIEGLIRRTGYDTLAPERDGMEAQLVAAGPSLAQSFNAARAVAIGITGAVFTFDATGGIVVRVIKNKMKAPGIPRVMGKQAWTLNGQTYTSAELLAAFPAVLPTPEARNPKGLSFGLWALDRSKNFKDYGMTTTQGYSQEAQKLAKALGAVGSRV